MLTVLTKYVYQRNGPIIHDVTSVNKENEIFSHKLTCFPRLIFGAKKENKEHIQFYLFTVRKAFYFKVITITNDFVVQ